MLPRKLRVGFTGGKWDPRFFGVVFSMTYKLFEPSSILILPRPLAIKAAGSIHGALGIKVDGALIVKVDGALSVKVADAIYPGGPGT
jgi:hypothetical protein